MLNTSKCLKLPQGLVPTGSLERGLTHSSEGFGAGSSQPALLPPPCTTSGPPSALRGFNLGPQKAQNTFSPLILVGFCFWLFSKLTQPAKVSLWADAQESPEVEWQEDRTTTFSSTGLTNVEPYPD